MRLTEEKLKSVIVDCNAARELYTEPTPDFVKEVRDVAGIKIGRDSIALYGRQIISGELVAVEGVAYTMFLGARDVESRTPDIASMLKWLPPSFRESAGGRGDSFMSANMAQVKGDPSRLWQWTYDYRFVEALLCLGIAAGQAEILGGSRKKRKKNGIGIECFTNFDGQEVWTPKDGGRAPEFIVKKCVT